MKKLKIYLDCCCCLNRPFDDQSNLLINLEAYAVRNILALCERNILKVISSDVLKDEIDAIPDILKKEKIKALESIANEIVKINSDIINRAYYFKSFTIDSYDALHLACAETKADFLITVDKKFLKKAQKIKNLKIKVLNPIKFLKEYYGDNN